MEKFSRESNWDFFFGKAVLSMNMVSFYTWIMSFKILSNHLNFLITSFVMYQIHSCAVFSDKMVLSFVCIKTMPEMRTKLMIQLILYSLWEEKTH